MTPSATIVPVTQLAVARGEERLGAVGLGSCVAILLHDPGARVAGLAHVLLPIARDALGGSRPGKFASTAVPRLVEEMEGAGAQRRRLVARLVGGASMFRSLLSGGSVHTGTRNVVAARAALDLAGIPLVGEDVGREHGRNVVFHASDGSVVVTAYQREEVRL
jgi:chemotaxis protein CheD